MKYYHWILFGIFFIITQTTSVIAEYYQYWQNPDDIIYFVDQATICARAVDERSLALNRNPTFVPHKGARYSLIAKLQNELETILKSYINHIEGPINTDNTEFVFFNTNTWRMAAGVSHYGFQRSEDGVSFSNGMAQSSDFMGVWIVNDLQGYKLLQKTCKTSSHNISQFRSSSGGDGSNCAEKLAAHDAIWAASDWQAQTTQSWIYAADAAEGNDAGGSFTTHRTRGRAAVTGIYTGITSSANIYTKVLNHPCCVTTFCDMDGYGVVENELLLLECLDASSSSNRQGSILYGNYDYSTVTVMGYECPIVDVHHWCGFNYSYWLLTWQFQHQ